MPRYAAFLRGINLGRRRVTGEELRAPFVELGFDGVATFLASGNVVFTGGDGEDEAGLARRIEAALEGALGFSATTFLRTAAELEAIVTHEPFSESEVAHTAGKLQVMLLRDLPDGDAAASVLSHASDQDRLVLRGRELYWLPEGNMSASALALPAIERLVGPNTMRTANTLRRMHAKFFGG